MNLADILSAIESVKRRAGDALANPRDAVLQAIGGANDTAGQNLQEFRSSFPAGSLTPKPEKQKALIEAMMNGPMGLAPAGILVGLQAQGTDKMARAYAMRDMQAGKDPRYVWEKWGWGKGPDGLWRTEINDSPAHLKLIKQNLAIHNKATGLPLTVEGQMGRGGSVTSLEEALHHPQLIKAYPEMKASTVDMMSVDPSWTAGKKMPTEGYFNKFAGDTGAGQVYARSHSPEELRNVILHEIQHGIQTREGFAGGGAPSQFSARPINPAWTDWQHYARLPGEAESRMVEYRGLWNEAERRGMYPWDPLNFQAATGVPLSELLPRSWGHTK